MRGQPSPIMIQRTNYAPDCKPDVWWVSRKDPPHNTSHRAISEVLLMVEVMLKIQLEDEEES